MRFRQNSMDCGSNRIDVTIERDGANTQIAVSNDGQPMTQDILVNKFLTLGGSAKDGGVGGFGKAKGAARVLPPPLVHPHRLPAG